MCRVPRGNGCNVQIPAGRAAQAPHCSTPTAPYSSRVGKAAVGQETSWGKGQKLQVPSKDSHTLSQQSSQKTSDWQNFPSSPWVRIRSLDTFCPATDSPCELWLSAFSAPFPQLWTAGTDEESKEIMEVKQTRKSEAQAKISLGC
jgi:hypothetical protein